MRHRVSTVRPQTFDWPYSSTIASTAIARHRDSSARRFDDCLPPGSRRGYSRISASFALITDSIAKRTFSAACETLVGSSPALTAPRSRLSLLSSKRSLLSGSECGVTHSTRVVLSRILRDDGPSPPSQHNKYRDGAHQRLDAKRSSGTVKARASKRTGSIDLPTAGGALHLSAPAPQRSRSLVPSHPAGRSAVRPFAAIVLTHTFDSFEFKGAALAQHATLCTIRSTTKSTTRIPPGFAVIVSPATTGKIDFLPNKSPARTIPRWSPGFSRSEFSA